MFEINVNNIRYSAKRKVIEAEGTGLVRCSFYIG
jgi:hypothetical protein